MVKIKVKYHPSSKVGCVDYIYYEISHRCSLVQWQTSYRIAQHEWDDSRSEVKLSACSVQRKQMLMQVNRYIRLDMQLFAQVVAQLEHGLGAYTPADILTQYLKVSATLYFFPFIQGVIDSLMDLGSIRTSETYNAAFSSFKQFRKQGDLLLREIDSEVITAYEAYLKAKGLSRNTCSFYLRNLRAVYNRAVDKGLIQQRYPFKHVYTGVERTLKRAVSIEVIKQIKELDLSMHPVCAYARSLFLFSLYTRGMSFVDMAYLRKSDLSNGFLTYRRRKTGQQLVIKWERCMQELINPFINSSSPYLLPIIKPSSRMDERRQYLNASQNVNRNLKRIGKHLGLPVPLTMYVARHAWVSIAKSKNVPLAVISEGMGHDSEATTLIYLASLDTQAVDQANSLILSALD